jgi:hypothetical protein
MPNISADSSAIVTVWDASGKPHTIRVTYMEQPPPSTSGPALQFNVSTNSMYLGGP